MNGYLWFISSCVQNMLLNTITLWILNTCILSHSYTDDDSRVILRPLPGHDDCQHDYINASYVDVRICLYIHTYLGMLIFQNPHLCRVTPFPVNSLPHKVSTIMPPVRTWIYAHEYWYYCRQTDAILTGDDHVCHSKTLYSRIACEVSYAQLNMQIVTFMISWLQ